MIILQMLRPYTRAAVRFVGWEFYLPYDGHPHKDAMTLP